MSGYLEDRAALAKQLTRVFETLAGAPQVDPTRVAAIGFCFGGLCVLDLARAGHRVAGVASFHGLLTAPSPDGGREVTAKVLVFHGWDDPHAPPEHVVALGRKLSGRNVDWQLHAYGNTMHAFMAPWADDPERGICTANPPRGVPGRRWSPFFASASNQNPQVPDSNAWRRQAVRRTPVPLAQWRYGQLLESQLRLSSKPPSTSMTVHSHIST